MFHRLIYKLNKGKDPFWDDLWDEEDDEDLDEEPIEDVVERCPGNPFKIIVVRDINGKLRIIDFFTRIEALKAKRKRDKLKKVEELEVQEYVKKLVRMMKPQNFEELVKVIGMSLGKGVWEENAEELLQDGCASLGELISCYEDVIESLVVFGLPEDIATKIAEKTSKGLPHKGKYYIDQLALLETYDVLIPDWFLWSLIKIEKLVTRKEIYDYLYRNYVIIYT